MWGVRRGAGVPTRAQFCKVTAGVPVVWWRRAAPWQRPGCVGPRDARLWGRESSAPGLGVLSTGSCQHRDNTGAAPRAPGCSGKLLSPGMVAHSPSRCHTGLVRTLTCSGQVTFTPMTRAGIDLGELLGNSQSEGNQQVELSDAPWVWISSSSPEDTGSSHWVPEGEDNRGTPALAHWMHPVLAPGLRAQGWAGGRRALEPALGGRRRGPPPRTSGAIQGQAETKLARKASELRWEQPRGSQSL